jgi:lysyl-tRNA synthetase class II
MMQTNFFFFETDLNTPYFQIAMFGLIGEMRDLAFNEITLTPVENLNETLEGQDVWIRGRLHNSRIKGKSCFVVIRHQVYTVQACEFVGETFSKEMLEFIKGVSKV